MRVFVRVFIVVFLTTHLATAAAAQDKQQTYANPPLGFAATKPVGWHYLSAEQFKENIEKLDDAKLKAFAAQFGKAPFFSITKYEQSTYDDLNPSVRAVVREDGRVKSSPLVSLFMTAAMANTLFKNARIAEGPVELTVGGKKGGYLRIDFTAELGGLIAEATSEVWVVSHKGFVFTISASTRKDESNGTRAEIRQIIDSIKLE